PPPLRSSRGRPLLARCARCAAPMPPDPVGRLERSRARPPPLRSSRAVRCSRAARAALLRCPPTPSAGPRALAPGPPPSLIAGRPLLARCARRAAPMPPAPFGRLERSRARPPPLRSSRGRPLLARAPHALRCSDAPDPLGRRERSRPRPPPLHSPRARPVLARAPHALRASDAPRPRWPERSRARRRLGARRRGHRLEAQAQPLRPAHDQRVDPGEVLLGEDRVPHAGYECLERDTRLEARQCGPEAEVDAVAERDVVPGAARHVEAIGLGEDALVPIRRPEQRRDDAAR